MLVLITAFADGASLQINVIMLQEQNKQEGNKRQICPESAETGLE